MNHIRKSFWKTTVSAAMLGTTVITAGHLAAELARRPGHGIWQIAFIGAGWLLGLPAVLAAAGGLIGLQRDADQTAGRPDLFLRLNSDRSESALPGYQAGFIGRLLRAVTRRRWAPRVGDMVEILSLPDIMRTLDANGSIDGLPFQAEMAKFCGQRARVFRSVDKIYDYGRTKTLKRLTDSVLLVGLRCDGSAHDGCEAGCRLMWKTSWLKPVEFSAAERQAEKAALGGYSAMPVIAGAYPGGLDNKIAGAATVRDGNACYKCQFTELAAASTPMKRWDFRQDLRPLLSGNITLAAFSVAILTRLFNLVQRMRGGIGFPAMVPGSPANTAEAYRQVMPRDIVRVLSADEISRTLNRKSRNRGLWFDADMLKHAAQRRTVLKRVSRIIDDATGRMVEIKTPCIVLDGVECSGEFLRFCAQHDYPYWREAWLAPEATIERPAGDRESVATAAKS